MLNYIFGVRTIEKTKDPIPCLFEYAGQTYPALATRVLKKISLDSTLFINSPQSDYSSPSAPSVRAVKKSVKIFDIHRKTRHLSPTLWTYQIFLYKMATFHGTYRIRLRNKPPLGTIPIHSMSCKSQSH